MKKLIAIIALAMVVSTGAFAQEPAHPAGGLMGGVAGCCFGIRAAADYNDGKEISIREWLQFVPVVNWVIMVMNGIDGYNGVNRAELQSKYGARYF